MRLSGFLSSGCLVALPSRKQWNSNYDSLQATLKKDMSHGFQFLAAYTYSKSIDDAGIVSVLLSLAHSDYRSLGRWFTTIKTMSLLSAVCLILIELTDWFSAARGVCRPDHATSAAIRSSEVAGASRVSPRCSRTPIQHPGQRSRYTVWSATIYTTGSLATGATLGDAGRSGSVGSRVNEFFNTKTFVPAPYIPMVPY